MSTPTSVSSIEQRAGLEKRGLVRSVRWNLSRAWIVTRRELVDMLRDWRIAAPVLLLSLITPGLANWGAEQLLAWIARYGATLVGDRIAPFLLLAVGFFPASFSLIIALESFVGEKERRSLEPLLSSPLTDTQVYIGKTLAATMPPVLGSLLAMVVYVVGQGLAGNPTLAPAMLVQIALLNILHALVMVAGAVIVSSQVTSVRAANLPASFIIVPIALLLQAEAFIIFWGYYGAPWWMILGLAVIYVILVRMGVRSFNREDLLGGEIDEINLVQMAKQLWRLVLARREDGARRSPWQWYREEVLGVVTRTRPAIGLVAVAMFVAFLIGRYYGSVFGVPPEAFVLDDWYARFHSLLIDTGLAGLTGILLVLVQNVRVLLIGTVLAIFSVGVLVVLILMLPIVVIGYVVAQMAAAGMDPVVVLAALLPHSLFEVPAAVLAGGLAVRLGASVLAPPPGKRLGEGWLEALADTIRLWWLLILPLLVAAAVVEVYVTPALVSIAASGG